LEFELLLGRKVVLGGYLGGMVMEGLGEWDGRVGWEAKAEWKA